MIADRIGVLERDRVLPVVPMFHANAWGLAHARVARRRRAGVARPADLTPAAIAALIEDEQVTVAAGVPTIWMGLLPELDGPRPVLAAGDPVRRLGGAPALSEALPGEDRHADPAGLGDDRDQPARLGQRPSSPRTTGCPRTSRPTCGPRQGIAAGRRGRADRRAGHADRAALGRRGHRRAAGARAVDRGRLLQRRALARTRSPRTAGCAPATSPRSTATATSGSSTAPRTW